MEQAVWLTVGIIALIIAISITMQLIARSSEQDKVQILEQSMQRLSGQCNTVCDSPKDTLLSIEADLPSGILLKTNENRMCAYLEDAPYCSQCNCNLSDELVLNLTDNFARKFFSTHTYSCSFLRGSEKNVFLECKG